MDDFYNETSDDECDVTLSNNKKNTKYSEFLNQVCYELAQHCEHHAFPLCEFLSLINVDKFTKSI